MTKKSQIFSRFSPFTIAVLFFGISQNIFSQSVHVSGKVIDNSLKYELSGATIKIGEKGFVSDNKGYFSFTVERDVVSRSNIIISYVGYKSDTIKAAEDLSFYLVALSRSEKKLDEVTVYTGGRKIIEKAIEKIPENYPTRPVAYNGLYKTHEFINDTDYYYKNEAQVRMYTPSYLKPKDKSQISLIGNRSIVINNFDSIEEAHNKNISNWTGGYDLISFYDIVKSNFRCIDFNYLNQYTYSIESKAIVDSQEVYCIDIHNISDSLNTVESTIYIDTKTFAVKGYFILMGEDHFINHSGPRRYTYSYLLSQVFYDKKEDGKWYLKNSHFEQRILKQNIHGKTNIQKVIDDYVTTSILIEGVYPFTKSETIPKNARMILLNKDIFNWGEVEDEINKKGLRKYLTQIDPPAISKRANSPQ